MKITRKNQLQNDLSFFTVSFGIVSIVINFSLYFFGIWATVHYYRMGILVFSVPYEGIVIKIYLLSFLLAIISAVYAYYKRKPIAWYLYYLSFVGLILKFQTLLFWKIYFHLSWIVVAVLPIHLCLIGNFIYHNVHNENWRIIFERRNGMRHPRLFINIWA
jgi:hypothetical protein